MLSKEIQQLLGGYWLFDSSFRAVLLNATSSQCSVLFFKGLGTSLSHQRAKAVCISYLELIPPFRPVCLGHYS